MPIRLPKVAAVLRCIPFDVEELTRARCTQELQPAKVANNPRAERRRRLAEPDLSHAESCVRAKTSWRSTQQGDLAWAAYQVKRRWPGQTDADPFEAPNPVRPGQLTGTQRAGN
ncbi:hypothetical protein QJ054_32910 [Streptomyces sp. AN-3]|uniref:Transposase n=1 Tax=Streptomyces rochei TaxID=1928 RepID=A0ABW7E9X5_STRRO|nr:hypothetical protein [Streptomyces sp. AN-3]MDI3101846.1 hypothetical protein [Streptomyces sp. AN-3]